MLLIGFSLREEEICLLMHQYATQYKKIILVSQADAADFDSFKTSADNLLIKHTTNCQVTFINDGFDQQAQRKIIKALSS